MYLFVRFSLRLQNCPLGSNSNGPFRKYTCAPMYSNLFQGDFSFFVRNPTRSHQQVNKLQVGMTGFEPAASWSQTRRSSQTELHSVHYSILIVCCKIRKTVLSDFSTPTAGIEPASHRGHNPAIYR